MQGKLLQNTVYIFTCFDIYLGTDSHNNMDSCADSNNSNSLLHDDKSETSGKFQEEFYKD